MKILFIYGFGGNPDSTFCRLIREALAQWSEYQVLCYEYPQHDCQQAKEFLEGVIARENIDVVVGTSLGGFITLALDTDKRKVVLNPCMRPSVELPLLKPRPGHPEDVAPSAEMIATYTRYEEAVNAGKMLVPNQVTGLFGVADELFGTKYFAPFLRTYGDARLMPGGHHGNSEAIPAVKSTVTEWWAPEEGRIKVCEGWYSGSVYEMETWIRCDKNEPSDEDIVAEMHEQGFVSCANYERHVGYYPTRQRAEETLDELHESCWEQDHDLDFAVIRQKVMYVQMAPTDYIKEWTYGWDTKHTPIDETLVRNYDLDRNPFMGRPKEMIRHKVDDIVIVYNDGEAYWGIVCALPPTPEEVKENPERTLDYSDDCYTIITSDTGLNSHEHVPSHRVMKADWLRPPKRVVELLKEALKNKTFRN